MKITENPEVSLKIVVKRREIQQFLALPHRIYAADPNWIAPLNFEQRQRFSPRNKFFQHARWRAWIALRGREVVGRITAQVDQLHLKQHADHTGYFGLLESEADPRVVAALLDAAESWLRGEGMLKIRGPFNLHINEEVGLLVDGFYTPPFFLMGHARPWYGPAIEEHGYQPAQDLLAYHIHPNFQAPRVMLNLAKRASSKVTVRSVRRQQLVNDAAIMRDIFNDAWQNNWGFVPLEENDWLDTVKTLTKIMPDDYIQIAELDGEPAAFIVALPNINEAIRDLHGRLFPLGWIKLLWRLKIRHPDTARIPLMGVRQKYQHSRMGPTLAFMVIDAVRKALHTRGVKDVEMGWILEDNAGMRNIIETIGGVAYKRYRVYEKSLAAE